jgi:Beta-ketoacyl synthase, N-terminal domain
LRACSPFTPLNLTLSPDDGGEGTGEESVPIAVVGLDMHFGTLDSKQAAQESDFQGQPLEWTELNWWGVEQSDWFRREVPTNDHGFAPAETSKPVGRGISEVRLPMGKFRIPPLEMQDMLPQQQLMLKVAAGALEESSVERRVSSARSEGEPRSGDSLALGTQHSTLDPSRTGVFIGIELDPNTTNFHLRWSIEQDAPRWAEMLGLDLSPEELAEWTKQLKDAAGPPLTPNRVMGNLGGIVASRLAREFDVGGPSFTVSCGGDSGSVAFDAAVGMLRRGELDRAIVGAVDLSCDIRCLVGATERKPQDGAIGFVLQRLEDARRAGTPIQAVFEGDVVYCRLGVLPTRGVDL